MITAYEKQQAKYQAVSALLIEQINHTGRKLAEDLGRKVKIMEVCGTHTVAFARSGITEMVSEFIDLRSGPGCPICVTHQNDLDQIFSYASEQDVVIATFGDLLRVPGTFTTLEKEKAMGSQIQICYSPLEAIEIAAGMQQAKVIFIAIGFETTAPLIASTIIDAKKENLDNFWVYPLMKLVPPALQALLDNNTELGLDGFILPGHVSAVLGRDAFNFISAYHMPAVVTGFENIDLLNGLYRLLQLILEKKNEIANAYAHVVSGKGNKTAQELIGQCFSVEDNTLWRGFGSLPASGLTLRGEYAAYDARNYFETASSEPITDLGCMCGEVITGQIKPVQCPLFGSKCNPSMPAGPCMITPEGACGSYYKYL